jgi:hypothetical protein
MAVKAITPVMEAVQTSETLVNLYQSTRCYNPEDSQLHTHCCENLKSYYVTNAWWLVIYVFNFQTVTSTSEQLGSGTNSSAVCVMYHFYFILKVLFHSVALVINLAFYDSYIMVRTLKYKTTHSKLHRHPNDCTANTDESAFWCVMWHDGQSATKVIPFVKTQLCTRTS